MWRNLPFSDHLPMIWDISPYGGWLRNPAPVDRQFIPWFKGFQHVSAIFLVVYRISLAHPPYLWTIPIIVWSWVFDQKMRHPLPTPIHPIWVNYQISPTWNVGPFGDDSPLKTMIPSEGEQGSVVIIHPSTAMFPNFQRFFDRLTQAHLRFSHQLCVHLRMAWLGDFEGQKPAEMWNHMTWLVGGWPTPLKNMTSSVGMMKFPIYGKIKHVPNHQSEYNLMWKRDFVIITYIIRWIWMWGISRRTSCI